MFDLSSLGFFSLFALIGWFIYKVYIYPYYISPLRKLPGPPSTNPLIGNFRQILLDKVNIIKNTVILI